MCKVIGVSACMEDKKDDFIDGNVEMIGCLAFVKDVSWGKFMI